jgi:hypothetical protein
MKVPVFCLQQIAFSVCYRKAAYKVFPHCKHSVTTKKDLSFLTSFKNAKTAKAKLAQSNKRLAFWTIYLRMKIQSFAF